MAHNLENYIENQYRLIYFTKSLKMGYHSYKACPTRIMQALHDIGHGDNEFGQLSYEYKSMNFCNEIQNISGLRRHTSTSARTWTSMAASRTLCPGTLQCSACATRMAGVQRPCTSPWIATSASASTQRPRSTWLATPSRRTSPCSSQLHLRRARADS